MTPDPALDRVVCEFLGIAPRRYALIKCTCNKRSAYLSEEQNDYVCECPRRPVYPPVSSTWEGFGMVVKRLDEVDLVWTKDIVLNTENMQEEHVVYLRNSVGQNKDLRRALALAVVELAGRES